MKSVWARAVCRASADPLNAASQAVTVVPMFIPKTVAAAASKERSPCCASVIAIAVVAAEDCTTAVNASETRTHLASPHAVVASSDLNTSTTAGIVRTGSMPSFIQYRPMKTNPSPISARPRLCSHSRFWKK